MSGIDQDAATHLDDAVGLVVFHVGGREYAVPVEAAVEIIRMVAITPVPESPPWLAGVLDLRGTVIPVVDLRVRLGFEPEKPGLSTPIVVVQAGGSESAPKTIGLIADEVVHVIDVPSAALEPPAELAGANAPYSSVARTAGRLIVLLDAARIGSGADVYSAGR